MSGVDVCTPPEVLELLPGVVARWTCPDCGERWVCFVLDGAPKWMTEYEWEAAAAVEREQNPPVPVEPVAPDEPVAEEEPFPVRLEVFPVLQGKPSPLVLDLGSDPAIVIQPKADQTEGELAVDLVFGGGLTIDVVAWMLAQVSEAIIRGEQRARLL